MFLEMKTTAGCLTLLCIAGISHSLEVRADEIYKSVDEYGNVTYSNLPPESNGSVQVIQAIPEPSEEEVKDAIQR